MLALDHLRADLRDLPVVARLGLAVAALGGLADVVTHASFADGGGAAAHAAHGVVFAGMVLVLTGVLVDGSRQLRARRRTAGRTTKGGT